MKFDDYEASSERLNRFYKRTVRDIFKEYWVLAWLIFAVFVFLLLSKIFTLFWSPGIAYFLGLGVGVEMSLIYFGREIGTLYDFWLNFWMLLTLFLMINVLLFGGSFWKYLPQEFFGLFILYMVIFTIAQGIRRSP